MPISIESSAGTRRRCLGLTRRVLALGLLASLFGGLGCGQTQVAASHRELVLQLATASSTRDAAMMDRVAAEIKQLDTAGELSDGEKAAFRSIVDAARQDQWDRARDLAYALRDGQQPTAEDQERVARRTLRAIKKTGPSGTAKGHSP